MKDAVEIDMKKYLDDVEARISAAQEERLIQEWLDYCDLKCTSPFFFTSPYTGALFSGVAAGGHQRRLSGYGSDAVHPAERGVGYSGR